VRQKTTKQIQTPEMQEAQLWLMLMLMQIHPAGHRLS
jgi:hypothetical protein